MDGVSVALLFLIFATPVAAGIISLLRLGRWVACRLSFADPARRHWVERRRIWIPCAATLAVYAGCFAYGAWIESRWVEVTRTEIRVEGRIGGRERFRIVHLSDLHLERIGSRERRVLERVREAQPDLILLTGDYLNARGAGSDLVEFLSELRAPLGVYGVSGNWDSKFPVAELFATARAVHLSDDYARVSTGTGRDLLLVGLDLHPHRPPRELLEGAAPGSYKVMLHHMPDAVDELPGAAVDLFLCGHTHGGQVRLPFWGAVVTFSRHHKRYEMGLYRVEPPATGHPKGTIMYVNRGVGMEGGLAPRVRFLCRPEVAVIELVGSE